MALIELLFGWLFHFHTWTKWTEPYGESPFWQYQKRRCEICGLAQERSI